MQHFAGSSSYLTLPQVQLICNKRVEHTLALQFLLLLEPNQIGILVEDLKEAVAVINLMLDLVA